MRIGSPEAPRWMCRHLEARAGVIGIVVVAISGAMLAYAAVSAFTGEDLPRRVGTVGGIVVVVAGTIGGLLAWLVVWSRHWRWTLVVCDREKGRHPDRVVLVARLPSLDLPHDSPWHPRLNATRVVVSVGVEGLTIFGRSSEPLFELQPNQIREITAAEYVEEGRAYDGVALVRSDGPGGIVLQMVEVGTPWLRLLRFAGQGRAVAAMSRALGR